MSSQAVYNLTNVSKVFAGPVEEIQVLRKIDLAITEGETVAIHGSSGSGKTTLLHIMGSLDTASNGSTMFYDVDLGALDADKRSKVRNRDIGFIFQFHNLLPEFTALENVAMPGIIAGLGRTKSFKAAEEALELAGLSHRSSHKVTTLSGGERQRAAIARAILLKPRVLLADEPTGSLDEINGRKIGDLLVTLNRELGTTLVVVTHNRELAGLMDRRLELRSGELYVEH